MPLLHRPVLWPGPACQLDQMQPDGTAGRLSKSSLESHAHGIASDGNRCLLSLAEKFLATGTGTQRQSIQTESLPALTEVHTATPRSRK